MSNSFPFSTGIAGWRARALELLDNRPNHGRLRADAEAPDPYRDRLSLEVERLKFRELLLHASVDIGNFLIGEMLSNLHEPRQLDIEPDMELDIQLCKSAFSG